MPVDVGGHVLQNLLSLALLSYFNYEATVQNLVSSHLLVCLCYVFHLLYPHHMVLKKNKNLAIVFWFIKDR